MIEKTSAKEFKQFCKDYLEKKCEQQTIQFTALSGYNFCGGAKSKGEDYYSATIKCIAYIDEKGEVVEKKVNFTYYLNNKKTLKFIKTKNLTTYKILCKKFKDKDLYYLLKIRKVRDKRFNNLVSEYLKPITVDIDGLSFSFNKQFSQYDGKFTFNNKKIDITLEPARNSTDATNSIATFKKINADFDTFYKNILTRCAKEIVDLANDWNDDEQEITENEIINRINEKIFCIEINESDFSIYFEDDDLFLGHTIIYYGNIENDKVSVDIAG